MIIVIEGGDAAGKQTQSTMLAEKIKAARFTFPNYDSPTGKLILAHLKKEWICAEDNDDPDSAQHYRQALGDIDARVFQSLQSVNRLEFLPSIIDVVQQGGSVVFDRYWQSACVYGILDGLDEKWLRLTQESPMPPADINILIDVPVEEGFKRRPERRDRYESNRPFMERVRTEYLKMWDSMEARPVADYVMSAKPGWYIVAGTRSVDEVHHTILNIVGKTLTGARERAK